MHELKWCPVCKSATANRCTVVLQVESVQLASESAQKQLEAELAAAKRDAAQAAAAHKSTAASRQSELDWQKAEASRGVSAIVAAAAAQACASYQGLCACCTRIPLGGCIWRAGTNHESCQSMQVGRLRRELERMESERDRAREAASQ